MNFSERLRAVRAAVRSAEFYRRLREFDPQTITRWPLTVAVDNATDGSLFVWHGSPHVSLARGDSWVVVAYPDSLDLTVDTLRAWRRLVEACPPRMPDARHYLVSARGPINLGSPCYGATGTGLDDFALRWARSGDWIGLFMQLLPGS